MSKNFEFEVFRLNVVDEDELGLMGQQIKGNTQILQVLEAMSQSIHDVERETHKATYVWSVRECTVLTSDKYQHRSVLYLVLSQSIVNRAGQTVTDDGIDNTITQMVPPAADSMVVLICMNRHIAAVERNSNLMSSKIWLQMFSQISYRAAQSLGFSSMIALEPIPDKDSLIKIFYSFSKLTRLLIRVRLPNPDLARTYKPLFEQLKNGGINDYKQDMRNQNGLNKAQGELPHASISMAEAGYKHGRVTFIGVREGKHDKVITGDMAARGSIPRMRDYFRGLKDMAKTKEAQKMIDLVLQEVDRVVPADEKPNA